MSISKSDRERFWQQAAKGLAWRINFGWWLDRWIGWLLGSAILGALTLILLRWMGGEYVKWFWPSFGGLLLVGAILSWWSARVHFEGEDGTRVRLEDALRLHSRLSAAASGMGEWPEHAENLIWPIKWRWQKLAGILVFGVAMLWLAGWIPIKSQELARKRVIEKPTAVKEVEHWMEQLREHEAVEEESMQALEEKVVELLKRPSENWYEHGSLEAAENLKEQTADMLRELAQNLSEAERAAEALQAADSSLPQAAKEALEKQLKEASQGLCEGGMKPNEQLLQQLLQQGGMEGLNQLNQQALQNLAENFKRNSQALQKALENSPELDLSQFQTISEDANSNKPKDTEKIQRGPGEAPMVLSDKETNLNTIAVEKLQLEPDLQRLAPGDMLGTTDGKHEVDMSKQGHQQGGNVNHLGDGGAAVWRDSLLPAERETLRRYFK